MFERIKILPEHKKTLMNFIVLFGMALSDVVIIYCRSIIILNLPNRAKTNDMFLYLSTIWFTVLFMKLILHIEYYIHHYISLCLITFGIICFNYESVSFYQFIDTVPYYILLAICMSVDLVYCKAIMDLKYIQPLSMAFYNGLCGLGILSIMYLICYIGEFNHPYINDILSLPQDISVLFSTWTNFGYLILFMIVTVLLQNGIFIVVYFSNPIVLRILDLFTAGLVNIYGLTIKFNLQVLLVNVILAITIYLPGMLIFMEIMMVHVCGMEANTKTVIMTRANTEVIALGEMELVLEEEEYKN